MPRTEELNNFTTSVDKAESVTNNPNATTAEIDSAIKAMNEAAQVNLAADIKNGVFDN